MKFLLCHQGSDLRRAKGTNANSSMDAPGYWGQALLAFGAKEAQGYGESSSPHPPTAIGCQTQAQPQLPIICSPRPAQSSSSKGAKYTLNCFFFFNFSFFTYRLSPVPWSLEEKAGRCFWRCYYKNKVFFFFEGVLFGCLVEVKIWGYGVLLLLPFCKLHSWYFCSFHDCKLSRVGLAKRRLR